MILALPAALAMARACAPGIAPEAILSIISVESTFDPLAIHVNRIGRLHADSSAQAATLARRWITAGYSVDLGLAQINSRNLAWSGLTIKTAFEPCSSLAAAEKILVYNYAKASREAAGLDAISKAFSLYNTGNTQAGFHNSYVARVWRAAERIVPQIGPASEAPQIALASMAATPVAPRFTSFVTGRVDASVLISNEEGHHVEAGHQRGHAAERSPAHHRRARAVVHRLARLCR